MEQRIIELEKVVAFQGNAVDEIREVITLQQEKIETLEEQIKVLSGKLTDESLVKPLEQEDPPPHY